MPKNKNHYHLNSHLVEKFDGAKIADEKNIPNVFEGKSKETLQLLI